MKTLQIENVMKLTSYLLGFILLFSGISKLVAFDYFTTNISSYNVIYNKNIIIHLSLVLISLEIVLGVMLCTKRYKLLSAGTIVILLSFFLSFSVYSLIIKDNPACGCFGNINMRITDINHFVLLITLMAASIFVFVKNRF